MSTNTTEQEVTFWMAVRSIYSSVIALTVMLQKVIQAGDDVATMVTTLTGAELKEQQLRAKFTLDKLEQDLAIRSLDSKPKQLSDISV